MIEYLGEIIVGALALVGTLGGAYLANRKNAALLAYRLEQLEEKVEKHNKVVERTYHLEEQHGIFEEKLQSINQRVDGLAEYHKPHN